MKHVKRESSRKGLTTSAQMLWAVQNDAIRTFEVDRLAAVERLNTTFEVGLRRDYPILDACLTNGGLTICVTPYLSSPALFHLK